MGLYENMRSDKVSSLDLREAILVRPAETVRMAVEKMRSAQLGCVIVVDEAKKPIGMFTEAMLRHLIASEPAALDDLLEKQMMTTIPWVSENDTIDMVLEAMEQKNLRFVTVVNDAGEVVGLTGQKGLMEYIAESFPGEVMVQRIGTKKYPEQREGA